MRWIKHLSNSQDDEVLSELITEFGAEGYGIWWIVLEKIAAQIEQNPCTSVRYSARKWAGFCEVSVQRFRKVVHLLEKKMSSFAITDDGRYIQIDCPNILKYCDNWTLRKLKKPEKDTKSLCSNSVVGVGNPSHEVEVEVEVEVDKKKERKEKKKENILPDFISLDLWQDFKEHRSKLKGTMSVRAQELLIKKISTMSEGNPEIAKALIEQSIENGWKGIFPLKDLQSPQIPKATTVYQADMLQKEAVNQEYLRQRRQNEESNSRHQDVVDIENSPRSINQTD